MELSFTFILVFAEWHIVPTITNKSKSKVTIFVGNLLYLVCEAKGYPSPSVTWKNNGKVLQTNINKTDFIIDDTSEKDAGKYECEASNSVGTVTYTVEVAIKGKVTRTKLKIFLTTFKAAAKNLCERNSQKALTEF